MIKRIALLAAAAVLLLTVLPTAPASAIKSGQPDAEEHPYVGELLFYDADEIDSRFDDPGAWFSCSATMLSSTVIVTAGHCTYGVSLNGESTRTPKLNGSGGNDIWFDASEVAHFDGFPPSSNYARDQNGQRYTDRAAWLNASGYWHRGTAHPHPQFTEGPFYFHDAGVVVLDEPFPMAKYGVIPALKYLDQYRGQPQHIFEVVGYGLSKSGPHTGEGGDTREKAYVKIDTLNSAPKDTYLLVSDNNGVPHRGGTCFGDSGGPTFDNTDSNLVVAVTSFAHSYTCSGSGGVYRLDQPDDLAFLASFGIKP